MAEEYNQNPASPVGPASTETSPDSENHPIYDTEWVKEIARQSWEPELIISGVAIYLSISIHQGLDYLLETYLFDLSLTSPRDGVGLPLLIYSVFKSISMILALTFIVHFIIRAFWVATVGLLSVYPKGIVYKNLPFFNDFHKQQLELKLGRIEGFILNLDRTASSIFSTSFLFVITLTGVSFVYFFVFLLVNVSRLLMAKATYELYARYLFLVLMVVAIAFTLFNLILNLKWVKNNPRWAKIPFEFNWRTGNFLFPGIYRPSQYIILMYYANVSKTRIFLYAGGMMLFFMANVLYYSIYVPVPQVFDTRSYNSSVEDLYQVIPERYDNLIPNNHKSQSLSIQSDVIKDPYIRLFISYPKYLDDELQDFCPKWENPKEISRHKQRIFGDSSRIACLNRFFNVFIDGKAYTELDLRFGKHAISQEKGFVSILPLDSLSQGIHQLSIRKASRDSSSTRLYDFTLPFWYYPQERP